MPNEALMLCPPGIGGKVPNLGVSGASTARQLRWDQRFLDLARYVAQWSKDPSTKTGAVIASNNYRVMGVGYNGLARGVFDLDERLQSHNRGLKYKMIIHCERNAILFSKDNGRYGTLYTWPFGSCAPCAALVIQAGICRVVAPPLPPELADRWAEDIAIAYTMFQEAGVEVREIALDG